MDMSFHLSFNSHDPFELAVYRALKTLPRGYGKMFFLRMASMIFEDERNSKRMARVMFDLGRDVRPTSVKVLEGTEYKEGTPSQMLMYYPPTVEMEIPTACFRANGREHTRAKLKAIEEMIQDRKPRMKRTPKAKVVAKQHQKKLAVAQAREEAAVEASATSARPIMHEVPVANSNVVPIEKPKAEPKRAAVLSKLCWA